MHFYAVQLWWFSAWKRCKSACRHWVELVLRWVCYLGMQPSHPCQLSFSVSS